MLVAGIVIGKAEIGVLIDRHDGAGVPQYQEWSTRDFNSVGEVLQKASSVVSRIERTVVRAAGLPCNGGRGIKLTDVPAWAPFHPYPHTEVVSSVECVAAAIPTIMSKESRDINGVTTPRHELVAIDMEEANTAYRSTTTGHVYPTDSSHTTWQPWSEMSAAFLFYLKEQYRERAAHTFKDVLPFGDIYDFVSRRTAPGDELRESIEQLRCSDGKIESVVAKAALRGDHCAELCMRLWGPIVGQYLRAHAMSYLPQGGAIWLYRGVMEEVEIRDFVTAHTDIYAHCHIEGVALRQVVPSDDAPPLLVRGALALALTI